MNSLEKFIVRWYMPVLAEWIDVGTATDLRAAQKIEDRFLLKMKDVWKWREHPLKIGIVQIVETEVSGG